MRLSDIVDPKMVWADLTSNDKSNVIVELAQKIASQLPNLTADDITKVLMNREQLGSTGIEDGIAIPHAKVPNLEKLVVACGRSRQGISFDALDQKPTHLFFVLLAPEHSAAMHLKILARLSRLLKDKDFRAHIMAAKDAKDIYHIIIEEDTRH